MLPSSPARSVDTAAADGPDLLLRAVDLDGLAPGRLFLTAMPGRTGTLRADLRQISAQEITTILRLTDLAEVTSLSPDYATAWASGADLPPRRISHPIPDFSTPSDSGSYRQMTQSIANRLQDGERVLIHCAAGIGRTGMTAIAVLCALGLAPEEARKRVAAAGSGPETPAQKAFVQELVGHAGD